MSKDELRSRMRKLRRAQPGKEELSRKICERVAALPEFEAAATIMLYVDARSEVRTGALLRETLHRGKTVVIPYCDGDELVPWRLRSLDELSPGAYGILEPRAELRTADRHIGAGSIDLICVPGIAFDRRGNRLGSGKGYYDRLLPRLRPDAIKVGLAFECQTVDAVPVDGHDVPMGVVMSECETCRTAGHPPC